MGKTLAARKAEAELRKLELEAQRIEFELNRDRMWQSDHAADANRARVYSFHESVGVKSVAQCMSTLGLWARRDPGAPIEVVFNSPGGSVLDGLALYDYIRVLRSAGHEVTTVGLGMAASMGGILLQAGSTRVMGRGAWLMIHEVSSVTYGKASEMEDKLKFVQRLQAQLVEILAERSTLTAAQIRHRWRKTDWWLSAKDALSFGFIDAVR